MTFFEKLRLAAGKNSSRLCVGLDPEKSKISNKDFFDFSKYIVEQTHDLVCAYKPNLAFFLAEGIDGIRSLAKTIEYIKNQTDIPVILDAKCGDIGNTAQVYAKAVFEIFNADAVTVNPYMGSDSIAPFAEYKDHGVFLLCLTSNPSSKDFEDDLYIKVAKKAVKWNSNKNLGLVVGATKPRQLKEIQKITKDLPLLIPGVGAQGGDIRTVLRIAGRNPIINVSRSVIFSANPRKALLDLKKA